MSGLLQRTVRRRAAQSQAGFSGDEAPPVEEPQRDDAAASLRLRDRGRLRRRLHFLRRARELQLRDLGGLVFDLYRFGQQRDPLVRAKLDTVISTDRELRDLAEVLADPRTARDVRRPSVGGACPSCDALYPSDASFCSACGLALTANPTDAPILPNAGEPIRPADAETGEATALHAGSQDTPGAPAATPEEA